ncbi:hypothetical protein QAD02_022749, partial [Eretmocerus hayati]
MSTLGLIAKAVENLRSLQIQEPFEPDQDAKKKEKIANCMALTNGITLENVKAAPQVLNLSIETLLCLCDDSDPDVRTIADECLNKIIRTIADSYVLKVQFELYREIKRNGAARCLRAALLRFGQLSHMIRPVKAKVFASQLAPCILETVKRNEDIVIESLSQSLPLILKTLGCYLSDKETQVLLQSFIPNISSSEATFRRASANMILATCVNCRKPQIFTKYVMEQLIDMLFRIAEGSFEDKDGSGESIFSIFGAFTCLRIMIPCIDGSVADQQDLKEEQLLELYFCILELCLIYAKFYMNHNVINAALETLLQLLQNPPKIVVKALLSNDGIPQRISKLKERDRQWPSRLSLANTVASEDLLGSSSNLFDPDPADFPGITPKVEKWITEMEHYVPDAQKTSNKSDELDSIQMLQPKNLEDYSGLLIGSVGNEDIEIESNASSDIGKVERLMEPISLSEPDNKEEYFDDAVMSIVSAQEVSLDQYMIQRGDLEIGCITDNDSPLRYCLRLLTSSFLLTGSPGQIIPDKLSRVSIKSLVFNCLGLILRLSPDLLFISLVKNSVENKSIENQQLITDVLIFCDHPDPQVRGNLILALGYFSQGTLERCKSRSDRGNFQGSVTVERIVAIILKGLKDESAITCRQTIVALQIFLPNLLESEEAHSALSILKALPFLGKNPYFLIRIKLAELLSMLPYTTIDHVSCKLKFHESASSILLTLLNDSDPRVRNAANKAIAEAMPELWVERPTEEALTRKASLLSEHYICSAVTASKSVMKKAPVEHRLLLDSLPQPYGALLRCERAIPGRSESLSRLVGLLADRMLVFSSRHATVGSCEALAQLSEAYPTALYPTAWDCFIPVNTVNRPKKNSQKSDGHATDGLLDLTNDPLPSLSSSLFAQSVIMLSSSPLSLDLAMHRHLLLLAGNLASGLACANARPVDRQSSARSEPEPSDEFKYWTFMKDKQSARSMEQLLTHIMRLLNIFQHVIEDLPSPVQPPSKTSLVSLPSAASLSPRRRILSEQFTKSSSSKSITNTGSPSSSASSASSSSNPITATSAGTTGNSSESRLPFRLGSVGKDQQQNQHLGLLSSRCLHYQRLYELLRAAHSNFRVTLDPGASELYLSLLHSTLRSLGQLLEFASSSEGARLADELLHYLQSTLALAPEQSLHCVRQLLKCIFECNLLPKWPELAAQRKARSGGLGLSSDELPLTDDGYGFYELCFQRPARLLAERIKNIGNSCKGVSEPDPVPHGRLVSTLQKKEERKVSSILKILNRNTDQNSMSSYIRLFEPLVIKSLIQYTISNSVPLQCEVLMLLSQLVQLHINYCLMDSDKIFIGFVLKQFEFIEEGHIPQTEQLLPKIFDFLIRLSHEKYHSKLIIGVPKIIQLCDGLVASGQPPLTHCIPALVPVIEELFLAKNLSSSVNEEKELETTREVLMSMMLRLVEYSEIIELLARCLNESRSCGDGNGEEKWRKWSRQIMDTVLPMLASRRLRLESEKSFSALVDLLSVVSPTVFRPVDCLLKVLFTAPPLVGNSLIWCRQNTRPLTDKILLEFKRWMSMVNAILLSLISHAKEEAALARFSDVIPSIPDLPEILLMPDSSRPVSGDPLNVSGVLEPFSMSSEKIIARFIFRVIGAASSVVLEIFEGIDMTILRNRKNLSQDEYIIQQFSLLLQICIYMFETGSHCKVANASMQFVHGQNIPEDERLNFNNLNEAVREIGTNFPILTCQWTYLLTLLGFDDMSFWSKMIGTSHSKNHNDLKLTSSSNHHTISLNAAVIRRASLILFCDHVCENVSGDCARLSWLLQHHAEAVLNLADEAPVRELLAVAVHRETVASGLLVRAISRLNLNDASPSFLRKLLRCLEGTHQAQSGLFLVALVPDLVRSKYLALSRMAAKMASRRVEMLIALGRDEAREQLSQRDFEDMMRAVKRENLAKKHGALIGLLNKLATSHYDLEILDQSQTVPFEPSEVKKIKLDRAWFLSQVKSRCSSPCVSYGCQESAWLLSHLSFEECIEILSSEIFDVELLQECVIVGARQTALICQKLDIDGSVRPRDEDESILFSATKRVLVQRIQSLLQNLPTSHDVFDPGQNLSNDSCSEYTSDLSQLFTDDSFCSPFFSLLPTITSYMESLHGLCRQISSEHESDLCRFGVLCLEAIHHLISVSYGSRIRSRQLELCLICAHHILREPVISRCLGKSENRDLLCSAVAGLSALGAYLRGRSETETMLECHVLNQAMNDPCCAKYAFGCIRMTSLVSWIELCRREPLNCEKSDRLPAFLWQPFQSLVVSLARQPLVNSFVLTPPLLWKNGCSLIVGTGPTKCEFALFSSEPDYVPDPEVLEEFAFRASLLGWSSRQQFEEMWMALLGALNVSLPSSGSDGADGPEEAHAGCASASLSVRAITSLLAQTLMLPCPGDPSSGSPIAHPRDPQLSLHKNNTRRLFQVQDLLLWIHRVSNVHSTEHSSPKLEHIFHRGNLEPICSGLHAQGQLSISYLWSQCSLHEDKLSSSTLLLKRRRDEALAAASLDVNSCIRFLLELYTPWMLPGAKLPLGFLHEVVASVLHVSELFVERAQFQWMLDACMELWKAHPVEDEALRKHLVLCICKAAAVLSPLDAENLDKVKRLIDTCLKSGSLCMRMATLHGVLYLLQSAVLANCEDTMVAVHPLAIDYIQRYIDAQDSSKISRQSEEHQCLLWALVFFLLEHAEDSPLDSEAPAVLELVLSQVSSQSISISLHRMLLQ